jgi:hypothetical protein
MTVVMRALSAIVASVLFCGCVVRSTEPSLSSSESEVTNSIDLTDVRSILAVHKRERVLLALDIDDTLLTSPTFFGSDAWYRWQSTLARGSPGYVPCRFDVMAMSYEAGTLVPTQADAVAVINSISVDKVILTARSPSYRAATVRELKRAGYALPRPLTAVGSDVQYEWHAHPGTSGGWVDYRSGVFMLSGQDKGLLLLDLLNRLHLAYDRIVLIDDGKANIEAMRRALRDAHIAYDGIHYTRVNKNMDAHRVQEGIRGWLSWRALLAQTYPDRLRRLEGNVCDY